MVSLASSLTSIVAVMALCFAAWGLFFSVLYRRFGVGYVCHYLVTTAYFLFWTALIANLFWPDIRPYLANIAPMPFGILAVFMAAQTLIAVFVPRWMREPAAYFSRYPDRYFLRIDWRRIISKSADIVAQQTVIIVLVHSLALMGLSTPELLLLFGALFTLLHIPLLASEWGRWPSWLFGGAVGVFSIVFPLFILYVPSGYVYNIVFHWLFYTTMAVFFWMHYSRQQLGIVVQSQHISNRGA